MGGAAVTVVSASSSEGPAAAAVAAAAPIPSGGPYPLPCGSGDGGVAAALSATGQPAASALAVTRRPGGRDAAGPLPADRASRRRTAQARVDPHGPARGGPAGPAFGTEARLAGRRADKWERYYRVSS